MVEIVPHIWLGNLNAANNKTLLHKNDIKTILTISLGRREELPPRFSKFNNYVLILTQNVGMLDDNIPNFNSLNLLEHLMLPIRIVKESLKDIWKSKSGQGGILIHCQTGLTLSPSILIGYLIKERGMTMKSAYNLIVEKQTKQSSNYSGGCYIPMNLT